jgi:hypothetical protein
MPEAAIWERQASESPKAFDAFAAYRDMGRDRSTRRVARSLNKSHTLIGRWSSVHDWPRRAAAWDRERDQRRQGSQLDEIEEMTRRHTRIVENQLGAMMLPALELSRRVQTAPDLLGGLDAKTLMDLVTRSARPIAQLIEAERAVRGLQDSDEYSEERLRRREAERMSNEELDALLTGLPGASPPVTTTTVRSIE